MVLTTDSHVQLRIFLTDLPEPTGYAIYVNGSLASQSSWNSGIGYEENIPITGLSAGTYTFEAKVFFNNHSTITTNTVKLEITPTTSSFKSTAVAQVEKEATSSVKVSNNDLIAVGLGLTAVAVAGGVGYYLYKKH